MHRNQHLNESFYYCFENYNDQLYVPTTIYLPIICKNRSSIHTLLNITNVIVFLNEKC